MADLLELSWPAAQLGEALEALARQSGLGACSVELPKPSEAVAMGNRAAVERWIEAVAEVLGLEAEFVGVPYGEVERLVRGAGPALLRMPHTGAPRFLALLGSRRRMVAVLAPDLSVSRVPVAAIGAAPCQEHEAPRREAMDRLLVEAGVSRRRLHKARTALLREQLSAVWINDGWLLRLAPGASFWRQMRQARLPHYLGVLMGAYGLQLGLGILAWWVLGSGVLSGRLDPGWPQRLGAVAHHGRAVACARHLGARPGCPSADSQELVCNGSLL